MSMIRSQVISARRRMVIGQFGRSASVTLFIAFVVLSLAFAAPAIWVIDVDPAAWRIGGLVAGVSIALVAAAAHAIFTAPSLTAVATEVDRRFGLRERLSSSLAMSERERQTDFGLALGQDAAKRAEQIAIADEFALQPTRHGWLPLALLPVVAICALLIEPVAPDSVNRMTAGEIAEVKQVQAVAAKLKKRIAQQKRKADAKGLQEAKELFDRMESDLDEITNRPNLDRKQALIAMNDLRKKLAQRRDQLGSPNKLRQAMSQMKGLESNPAEKLMKQIRQGEFGKANAMANELADKLRKQKLAPEEQKALQKQLQQMQNQLQKTVQEHEKEQAELQEKINQAKQEGRAKDAEKMQQQLDQLRQQSDQIGQMKQMAQTLKEAAEAMQQGDPQAAADALDGMAEQLQEMQQEMSELQDLEEAMQQLSQSKDQMRCQSCGGAGCRRCGGGLGDRPGNGSGEGRGQGDRNESEDDTNTYQTQVQGNVKRGKSVIAGFADGPNRKGISRQDVQQAVQSALGRESDALENQALPKPEREHAQQYFDRLRRGD